MSASASTSLAWRIDQTHWLKWLEKEHTRLQRSAAQFYWEEQVRCEVAQENL